MIWFVKWRKSDKKAVCLINMQIESSRGMTGNARKSISYQITAVNFFSTIFCHFQPFSTIACLATLMAMTGNTRKSIFDHFPPFSTIFGHYLPGYLIVHNKKRAETHGCQFRPIPAMLTWLPLTSIVGHGMHGCDGATTLPREESSIPPHCLVV